MLQNLFCLIFLLPLFCQAQPWQPEVLWDQQGQYDSSAFGYDIYPLGDQNDDGYDDFAVLASGHGSAGGGYGPGLYFYHGGPVLPEQPYMSLHTDVAQDQWIHQAMSVGDINGDGYQDWMFNTYYMQSDDNQVGLFFGGPMADSLPDVTFSLYWQFLFYPLGDFNGDGAEDLYAWQSFPDEARIYFGGSDMDTLPDWTLFAPPPEVSYTYPEALGDFNGDGFSDILLSTSVHGESLYHVVVLLGSENPDTLADYIWLDTPYRAFAGIPDLNRDGADEVLFVTPDEGLPLCWGGNPLNLEMDQMLNYYVVSLHGANGAGDVNGDGYSDFLTWGRRSGLDGGGVNLYLGHPWMYPEPAWGMAASFYSPVHAAAGLGDINGDGVGDWAVGFLDYDVASARRGRVTIYGGDSTVHADAEPPSALLPSSLNLAVFPNPFNAQTEIRYTISHTSPVTLRVFDLLGREVALLDEGRRDAGEHRVTWNAEDYSSGVYFCRIEAGQESRMVKMVLLK